MNAEDLPRDFSLDEVAEALGMSERWLRARVKDGAEHQRYGHKIKFTAEQVEKLRAQHVSGVTTTPQAITTGRKRRAS